MSLTEKAYQERKWGSFPALRQALEDKQIPSNYFGPTSVSDNMFEAMNRLIEKVMTCHSLILCSYIIDEIHELFVRKFYDRIEYLDIFLAKFSYELVYTPMSINPSDYPFIRDESDLYNYVTMVRKLYVIIPHGAECEI